MADGGVVQRDDRADDALRNDQEHDLPPQAQRGCGPCIGDEAPSRVAGTAATTHMAADPYTSRRLDAAISDVSAMTATLMRFVPQERRPTRASGNRLPPRVSQITE